MMISVSMSSPSSQTLPLNVSFISKNSFKKSADYGLFPAAELPVIYSMSAVAISPLMAEAVTVAALAR